MNRVIHRIAAVWFVLFGGDACAPGEPKALMVVLDSAGVTVVESAGPSWTAETAWTVELAPLLDLGRTGSGSMHEFFRLEDATFGVGGGIVVADRGSAQVRFYDARGRFTAALGTDGDGPGEFRRLSQVERYAGDSVVAFDNRIGRGTVVSASGSLGRVVTFDVPDNAMTEDLYVPRSSGFFVGVFIVPAVIPRGRVRIPELILATSATGAPEDTVAAVSGRETYFGPGGSAEPPYARSSNAAVQGGELYVCEGDQPEYTVFAGDGTLRRVVRLPNLSLDVPEHVLDSIRNVLRRRDEFSRGMAEVLLPTYPFCSGLLVDELGYVWLERYHHPFRMSDEPRSWLIFSPDGEWLGQLGFPANFEIFDVAESRVLGMARDSMEVETVQVLRLERR